MADAIDEQIAHLELLIATLRRRQRVLETQRARFSEGTIPAHIVLELEDITRELGQHTADLRRLRPGRVADHNPYLGLLTFKEEDADRFFGRDELVADLIDRASRTSFLVVLGPSGSGKSSVVRAGLLPMLKGGALLGSDRWYYATLKPGSRPINALAAALSEVRRGTLGDASAIRKALHEGNDALLFTAELLLVDQPDARLVLVVDQAEELWTLVPTEEEARAAFIDQQQHPFVQLLLTAATAPNAPLLIILAMRADFLHRAAENTELARLISEHNVIVSPMTPDELRAAIVRPAQLVGSSFEAGLADALIKQTTDRPGALPLLEFTLQSLWEDKHSDGTLTWAAFNKLGGVEGALAAKADEILKKYYPGREQQDKLRKVLLRLVQPGEGVADTRRRVRMSDLVPSGASIDGTQHLLSPLINTRLLTTAQDGTSGAEIIEISHEALIRAWPTLGRWITEARADLRFQLQLEEAAKDWQTNDENTDFLWSGLRLDNAEAWLVRTQPHLNTRDQAFLNASRAKTATEAAAEEAARREREALLEARADAERRNVSRLRIFLAAAGVLLLLLLGVASYALIQRRAARLEARASEAQASAGEALFELTLGNADHALLLTRAATYANTEPFSPIVVRALHQAVQTTTPNIALHGHTAAILGVAWSPDGKQVLTSSEDNTVRVWDAASGKQLVTLEGDTGFFLKAVWSPDGKRVVVTSGYDTMRVWDVISGKPLVTLNGHTGPINAVAWSPDGKQLLTGSDDKTARLWDAATGKQLDILEGHTERINAVTWSPDGLRVLTRSDNTPERVWDVASGKLIAELIGQTEPVSAAWSPDGQKILTGSGDTIARVWDATSGKQLIAMEGHTDRINAVAWSPDGKQILTSSFDKTARVWNALTGEQLVVLEGHTDQVYLASWNPDGRRVLTGGFDNTARVWDVASGKELVSVDVYAGPIFAEWSPDGQHILTRTSGKALKLWDATNGKQLLELEGDSPQISSAAWSPDGKRVLTHSGDNTARIWDLASSKPFLELEEPAEDITPEEHITSAVWSPDSKQVLTSNNEGTIDVWDVVNAKFVVSLEGPIGAINKAAWSPDGKRILAGSYDKSAWIWDVASGKRQFILDGHTGSVNVVAWSPDGKLALTGSDDKTARVWDATSGKQLIVLAGHTGVIFAVKWSRDSKQVFTVSDDKTARVWDVATGKQLLSIQGQTDRNFSVAWSPDNKRIASSDDSEIARVVDVTSGKQVLSLEGRTDHINVVAWSPDGQRLLTRDDNKTMRIWDATSGKQLVTLEGHAGSIYDALWSPDGKRILTGSEDRTARLWDATNGRQLAAWEGHPGYVYSLAWSPDTKQILTLSNDQTIRIWIADNQLIIAELTRRVCDIFTDDDIKATIPSWRGCATELAAVADDLKEYDALRPRQ